MLQTQMLRFQTELVAMREKMAASEREAAAAKLAAVEADAAAKQMQRRAEAAETQIDFVSRLPQSSRETMLLRALATQYDESGYAGFGGKGALPSLSATTAASTAVAITQTKARVDSHGAQTRDRAGARRALLAADADREDRRRRVARQRHGRRDPLSVTPLSSKGGGRGPA